MATEDPSGRGGHHAAADAAAAEPTGELHAPGGEVCAARVTDVEEHAAWHGGDPLERVIRSVK